MKLRKLAKTNDFDHYLLRCDTPEEFRLFLLACEKLNIKITEEL